MMTCTSASPQQVAVAILDVVSVISRFSRGRLFTHCLTPNLETRGCSLFGLSSSTNLAWLDLPWTGGSPNWQTTENITMVALHQINISQTLTLIVDYIIEKEPLVNKFISVPKDKGIVNTVAFFFSFMNVITVKDRFATTHRQPALVTTTFVKHCVNFDLNFVMKISCK